MWLYVIFDKCVCNLVRQAGLLRIAGFFSFENQSGFVTLRLHLRFERLDKNKVIHVFVPPEPNSTRINFNMCLGRMIFSALMRTRFSIVN